MLQEIATEPAWADPILCIFLFQIFLGGGIFFESYCRKCIIENHSFITIEVNFSFAGSSHQHYHPFLALEKYKIS
jgi:hypothetical protein